MTNVINALNAALETPSAPLTPHQPIIVGAGAKLRSGLSARKIATKIIARQSEAGAPVGDIFSENSNIMETMLVIMIEEIISALQLDAKIEITIDPGVQVTTIGTGNLGSPVPSQGATTNIASGVGVIR